jgi:hypothetical protein
MRRSNSTLGPYSGRTEILRFGTPIPGVVFGQWGGAARPRYSGAERLMRESRLNVSAARRFKIRYGDGIVAHRSFGLTEGNAALDKNRVGRETRVPRESTR